MYVFVYLTRWSLCHGVYRQSPCCPAPCPAAPCCTLLRPAVLHPAPVCRAAHLLWVAGALVQVRRQQAQLQALRQRHLRLGQRGGGGVRPPAAGVPVRIVQPDLVGGEEGEEGTREVEVEVEERTVRTCNGRPD